MYRFFDTRAAFEIAMIDRVLSGLYPIVASISVFTRKSIVDRGYVWIENAIEQALSCQRVLCPEVPHET